MEKLSDYKDEINKCSKCGLCQAVCPIYKLTGNDCAVSRGKFVMLNGVLNGDLKLNKNINKYLDMCLKCGKCSEFCPSGIDVCKIFEAAKYEYTRNTVLGKLIFFLESKFVFGTILKFLKIFAKSPKKSQKDIADAKILKLLYFKGCAGNIFPYTKQILTQIHSIEIIEKDFDCCGIPFLSSGNLERFEEVKEYNSKLIKETEFDFILTDCASCESTLKGYNILSEDKFISLGELLLKLSIKFESKTPVKVTFHKPCHLKNVDFVKPLFKNCENVEYIEMEDLDDCCGFAGEFALKNHKLSIDISKKKAKNILDTGADYVITTCPSCIMGLRQGMSQIECGTKVFGLSEFLMEKLSLKL